MSFNFTPHATITPPSITMRQLRTLRAMIEPRFAALRKPGEALTKVADDIWVTDGPVASHFDDTAKGLVVYGLVLFNDIGLELHYRGGIFPLKPLDTYCINGHHDHAALYGSGGSRHGLFAARIWDGPPAKSLAAFAEEASDASTIDWIVI